ncbi:hypothetical protein R3P38DRAFT_2365509, partial [Favolaschia claudopus]
SPMDIEDDGFHPEFRADDEDFDGNRPEPLPPRFIFVKNHPHSRLPDKIIPLDASSDSSPETSLGNNDTEFDPDARPWAPFRSFADYKFATRCVKRRMTNQEIDEDLDDLHDGVFSSDCKVTFQTHRDVEKSLAAARITNISFHSETLVVDYDGPTLGKRYEVQVEFRDPWELTKWWACDASLVHVSTWHSQKKYLCAKGEIDLTNPLYNEPWTGETWWEVDVCFP